MTKAEIRAFEAIAINRRPHCSKKTIERLLACGVIATEKRKLHFSDGLPPSIMDDYYVPLRFITNGASGPARDIDKAQRDLSSPTTNWK